MKAAAAPGKPASANASAAPIPKKTPAATKAAGTAGKAPATAGKVPSAGALAAEAVVVTGPPEQPGPPTPMPKGPALVGTPGRTPQPGTAYKIGLPVLVNKRPLALGEELLFYQPPPKRARKPEKTVALDAMKLMKDMASTT